jgi:NADH:ubiquinone oxidoreductase subunit E
VRRSSRARTTVEATEARRDEGIMESLEQSRRGREGDMKVVACMTTSCTRPGRGDAESGWVTLEGEIVL